MWLPTNLGDAASVIQRQASGSGKAGSPGGASLLAEACNTDLDGPIDVGSATRWIRELGGRGDAPCWFLAWLGDASVVSSDRSAQGLF
jgi:hypothetical protein